MWPFKQKDVEERILIWIRGSGESSGSEIQKGIGLGLHSVYPYLSRMEAAGEIRSRWAGEDYVFDGAGPLTTGTDIVNTRVARKRVYSLPAPTDLRHPGDDEGDLYANLCADVLYWHMGSRNDQRHTLELLSDLLLVKTANTARELVNLVAERHRIELTDFSPFGQGVKSGLNVSLRVLEEYADKVARGCAAALGKKEPGPTNPPPQPENPSHEPHKGPQTPPTGTPLRLFHTMAHVVSGDRTTKWTYTDHLAATSKAEAVGLMFEIVRKLRSEKGDEHPNIILVRAFEITPEWLRENGLGDIGSRD